MYQVEDKQITIQGLIIPVDWDKKGNVIAIAVSTFDEDEYLIEKDKMGKRLISFQREEIEIKGTFTLKNDKKVIKVADYSIQRRF